MREIDSVRMQVIILGDSGVGKTSLMNQYVCLENAPSELLTSSYTFEAIVFEADTPSRRSTRSSAQATKPPSAQTFSQKRSR